MPKIALTDIAVKALKGPSGGQIDYWDQALPGFGVRVSQGGTKTFILLHGRPRQRETIGRYPVISLADARTEAKRLLAEQTLGRRRGPRIKLSDALTIYRAKYLDVYTEKRTAIDTERRIKNHVVPRLGHLYLHDIGSNRISSVLDPLIEKEQYSSANHVFSALRTFFRWAVTRQYIDYTPMYGMRAPAPSTSRERVLTADELKVVYKAAEEEDDTFSRIVLMLLLSAQRRGEISALRRDYLDTKERVVTLPPSLTKNGREHLVPYGPLFQAVLDRVPGDTGYLFPAREGDSSFTAWSKGKKALDKKCQIAPWGLHDLRRTVSTNMGELGVLPHVVEAVLNHISTAPAVRGVAAIYNRYTYFKEKQAALLLWEEHLTRSLAKLPMS